MRLAAVGRRQAGHDPRRPADAGVRVARHPRPGHGRDARRLVAVRARRGRPGGRRAGPHPDPGAVPGLRGQLPRGQRGRAARSMPTSRSCRSSRRPSRGSSTRSPRSGRWPRSRTRRSTSSSPCASGCRRVERTVAARRDAGRPRARGSSASSGSIRRSRSATGSPSRSAARAAGTCSARMARRLSETTWDAVAEVDPEMLFLMPCGFHLAETVREWAAPRSPLVPRPAGGPARRGLRRSTARRTSAGPGPGSSTASSCWPRSWIRTRSWTSPRAGAGPRSRSTSRARRCRSARPSPACGAGRATHRAGRTTWRAGRSSVRTASARPATTASCASGCTRPSPSGARRAGVAASAGGHGDRDRSPRRRPGRRTAATTWSTTTRPRAGEYDDWYLRRGRYSHGAIHDAAWNAELDAAGRWLDALPIAGEIVELAAGTGWWSPLLAAKGELSLYDAAPAPLDRARERLVAHGLRAHLHVRDAWAEPDRARRRPVHRVLAEPRRADRLDAFLALVGSLAASPAAASRSSTRCPIRRPGRPTTRRPADDLAVRRLADGREFTIVKVFHEPDDLRDSARGGGFRDVAVDHDRPLLRARDGPRRPGVARSRRGLPGVVHSRRRAPAPDRLTGPPRGAAMRR